MLFAPSSAIKIENEESSGKNLISIDLQEGHYINENYDENDPALESVSEDIMMSLAQ